MWGTWSSMTRSPPEQVEVLREAMDDADSCATFGWNGEPNPGPYGSLFRELLEEDDRFAFLLDHPPVLTRMKAILGNAVQLHSATGRVTPPGTPEQNWHRDGPWPQDPDGTPFGSIPGQVNCGYYLNELTMENGAIVILPGSHRAGVPDVLPERLDEVARDLRRAEDDRPARERDPGAEAAARRDPPLVTSRP